MDQKYIFNIGDEVIDKLGRCGKIVDICSCDRCELNGWNDIRVKYDGLQFPLSITHWDYDSNFANYYKIGNYMFGNIDLDYIDGFISRLEERLTKERQYRDLLISLLNKEAQS